MKKSRHYFKTLAAAKCQITKRRLRGAIVFREIHGGKERFMVWM